MATGAISKFFDLLSGRSFTRTSSSEINPSLGSDLKEHKNISSNNQLQHKLPSHNEEGLDGIIPHPPSQSERRPTQFRGGGGGRSTQFRAPIFRSPKRPREDDNKENNGGNDGGKGENNGNDRSGSELRLNNSGSLSEKENASLSTFNIIANSSTSSQSSKNKYIKMPELVLSASKNTSTKSLSSPNFEQGTGTPRLKKKPLTSKKQFKSIFRNEKEPYPNPDSANPNPTPQSARVEADSYSEVVEVVVVDTNPNPNSNSNSKPNPNSLPLIPLKPHIPLVSNTTSNNGICNTNSASKLTLIKQKKPKQRPIYGLYRADLKSPPERQRRFTISGGANDMRIQQLQSQSKHWTPQLDFIWGEVMFIFKSPIKTEVNLVETVRALHVGLAFIDELKGLAASMNVLNGKLVRWLLPYDLNSRIDTQSSTCQSALETMPPEFRAHIAEDMVNYLVRGANTVRRLVRVKIADDNDLEQARSAVELAHSFFKELYAQASKCHMTPFQLLEASNQL